jgi:hypothetical protein
MDPSDATFLSTAGAFLTQTALLSGVGLAAPSWLRLSYRRSLTETESAWAAVVTPVAGAYAAFAFYFARPWAGRAFSWAVLAAAAFTLVARFFSRPRPRAARGSLLALTAAAGVFYLAALDIFPRGSLNETAANRYLEGLPADNEIPGFFAARLYDGVAEKTFGGDWQASDRPPLQTGIVLLTMPVMRLVGWPDRVSGPTAGIWFQLLWIPAMAVFLRWLGATSREALCGCAGLTFTGFLLFHSVFVWPKLGSGALMLLAFCGILPRAGAAENPAFRRARFAGAGALAALAALAHGGVLFSGLALALIGLIGRMRAPPRRPQTAWAYAAAAFLIIYSPWLCFQHFYAPPGNRLIKWHIAGAIAPDDRSVATTLRENYREQGWAKSWEARRSNLATIFHGEWAKGLGWRGGVEGYLRRVLEWYYPLHAVGLWLMGLAPLGWLAGRRAAGVFDWRRRGSQHLLAAGWLLATLGVWAGLMYFPAATVTHQGSFAADLVLLGLLVSWALFAGRVVFLALWLAEAAHCAITWLPPGPGNTIAARLLPELVCAAAAAAVIALLAANFPPPEARRRAL